MFPPEINAGRAICAAVRPAMRTADTIGYYTVGADALSHSSAFNV
jgi:hypothetical protein